MNLAVPRISTCEALLASEVTKNIFTQCEMMLDHVNAALDSFAQADQAAASLKIRFPTVSLEVGARYGTSITGSGVSRLDVISAFKKVIDDECWRLLLQESGLKALMDAEALKDWEKTIVTKEMAPETVKAVFCKLYDSRGEMFERSIVRCYRSLSWDMVTNSPRQFGKKFIKSYLFSERGYVRFETTVLLDELMRILHVLDGTPEKIPEYGIHFALCNAQSTGEDMKNDFIQIRQFANGNGHVFFLRPDLVAKMNEVILKRFPKALPPPK